MLDADELKQKAEIFSEAVKELTREELEDWAVGLYLGMGLIADSLGIDIMGIGVRREEDMPPVIRRSSEVDAKVSEIAVGMLRDLLAKRREEKRRQVERN